MTGRLKIAQVVPPWFDLPPKGYGGTERVVALLADGLIERGHDVHVIGAGGNGTRATQHRTYDLPQGDRITYAVPEICHATWADAHIRREGFDVVHDHTLAGPLTAAGRPTPTVVTTHGIVTGERGQMYRHLARSVSLVAISRAQAASAPLPWRGVVHNALDLSDYPYRNRDDRADWVLFVGRTTPDKGLREAILAARAAGRRLRIAAKCTELAERAYFAQEIKPLLRPGEWLGEVKIGKVKRLMADAYCLIAPSMWAEPFGMVFIEALACGTPVVTMSRGAAPEIVLPHVGFVCDDVNELSRAIEKAGDIDPAECRQHVRKFFNPQLMARRYERIYREVLGVTS